MNIHPIIVHFPIALLSLYTLMEIVQFKQFREHNVWQAIKTTFLVLGVLMSCFALQTGEGAQESIARNPIIYTHSTLAGISTWFFGILSAFYIVRIINTQTADIKNWFWNTRYIRTFWMVASKITDIIANWWPLFIVLGIVGLVLISVVGALGGAIVYGPNIDPAVSFVYHLFF